MWLGDVRILRLEDVVYVRFLGGSVRWVDMTALLFIRSSAIVRTPSDIVFLHLG